MIFPNVSSNLWEHLPWSLGDSLPTAALTCLSGCLAAWLPALGHLLTGYADSLTSFTDRITVCLAVLSAQLMLVHVVYDNLSSLTTHTLCKQSAELMVGFLWALKNTKFEFKSQGYSWSSLRFRPITLCHESSVLPAENEENITNWLINFATK